MLSAGKAKNQNHAMIFTRGEGLQTRHESGTLYGGGFENDICCTSV